MDRRTIRNMMIERIQVTLEEYVEEINIDDLIDEDTLNDFLWEKDYGRKIVENFVTDHTDDLVADYLEEIYNEIDSDDLSCPF